jgi:hypothetical protein
LRRIGPKFHPRDPQRTDDHGRYGHADRSAESERAPHAVVEVRSELG